MSSAVQRRHIGRRGGVNYFPQNVGWLERDIFTEAKRSFATFAIQLKNCITKHRKKRRKSIFSKKKLGKKN